MGGRVNVARKAKEIIIYLRWSSRVMLGQLSLDTSS